MRGLFGAASAYNSGSLLQLGIGAAAPVSFSQAGPAFGTVQRANATTFTATSTGIYRVTYRLDLVSSAVLQTVQPYVGGSAVGPARSIPIGVLTVADTVLVNATAGQMIQLRNTGLLPLLLIAGDTSSILIEQIG